MYNNKYNYKKSNCIFKNKHETEQFYLTSECPSCGWCSTELRQNIKKKGKNWQIDMTWLVYDSSACYTTFDGRHEGGAWKRVSGHAILNKDFCIIKKIEKN